jgi:hypothetical protein
MLYFITVASTSNKFPPGDGDERKIFPVSVHRDKDGKFSSLT